MQFLVPPHHREAAVVYAIRNSVDSRIYVGSTQNLALRYSQHKNELGRGAHHTPRLQAFASEHGCQVLSFELLELVCEGCDLGKCEQKWIKSTAAHKPACGFNSDAHAASRAVKAKKVRLALDVQPQLYTELSALAKARGVHSVPSMANSILIKGLEEEQTGIASTLDMGLLKRIAGKKAISITNVLRQLLLDEAYRLGI